MLRLAVGRILSGPRRGSGGGHCGAGPAGRSSRGPRWVVLAAGPGHPLRLLRGHSTARRERRLVGGLCPSRAASPAPSNRRHLPLPLRPPRGRGLRAPPRGSGRSGARAGSQGTRAPARLGPLRTQPRDGPGVLTPSTTSAGTEDGGDRDRDNVPLHLGSGVPRTDGSASAASPRRPRSGHAPSFGSWAAEAGRAPGVEREPRVSSRLPWGQPATSWTQNLS